MAADTTPSNPITSSSGPEQLRAWGFSEAHGHAHPMEITRRAMGPDDVKMDIL